VVAGEMRGAGIAGFCVVGGFDKWEFTSLIRSMMSEICAAKNFGLRSCCKLRRTVEMILYLS